MGGLTNHAAMIHGFFQTGHPGRAFVFMADFVAVTSAIAFMLVAVMSGSSSMCWTAVSGYCVIVFGCTKFLLFIWAGKLAAGPVITGAVFDNLLWILIGLWFVLVGHGCC